MIESERLVMRPWRDEDVAPFQRICSDLEVMATLGPPLDLEATAARIGWMRAHEAEQGHCFWALNRREDARLIGWCGVIGGDMGPVADRVEIGWRPARASRSEERRGGIELVSAWICVCDGIPAEKNNKHSR